MSLATISISPENVILPVGGMATFNVAAAGDIAVINGAAPTWQNIVGAAIQSDGSLKKTTSLIGWGDSGATSVEEIAVGDGYVEAIANTQPAIPEITYPEFGGRLWFFGLTSKANVTTFSDIDFGVQIFQGGVVIYESGVLKRNARAPRNNGVYRVGIENGVVIWRADNEIIYRSGTPITYPQRFGVAFFHGGFDYIGGNPTSAITYTAENELGQAVGTWNGNEWTAPNVRASCKIIGRTSNFLFATAHADVHARFPNQSQGLKRPSKLIELAPDWTVIEQIYEDQASDVNVPFPDQMVRRFRLEFRGLSAAQAQILDNFYLQHKKGYAFYFLYTRTNELLSNVRFSKYDVDHKKVWNRSRIVELIQRPV